jgi:C4-type Zn-finger protein
LKDIIIAIWDEDYSIGFVVVAVEGRLAIPELVVIIAPEGSIIMGVITSVEAVLITMFVSIESVKSITEELSPA